MGSSCPSHTIRYFRSTDKSWVCCFWRRALLGCSPKGPIIMRILLITNYMEDRQKSMIRFGTILLSNHAIESNCKVEELYPQSFFNKISPSKRWKKWAAYLDKYLIFPKKIKHKLQNISKPIDLIHVIDHSNSVYLPQLKRFSQTKKIITCHDLIAFYTNLCV